MANLNDVLKSVNFNPILPSQFGLSSQIITVTKAQNTIMQSFSKLNMLAEITKSLKNQTLFFPTLTSAVDAMAKSMEWRNKLAIPNSAFITINSINRQHELLFGNFRGITDALRKNQLVFSKVNNLQFALSGISGQLASIALSQKKWDLLEDFEEITEEAVAIKERIFDNDGITIESLKEIKSFLQRIEIRVDNIDGKAQTIFWKLFALISFLLAVYGGIRDWQSKPEYATRQEVETVIKEKFSLFERKSKEINEYRTLNRKCKVMLKPKNNYIIIETLPSNFEIIVLQVHHKWIYVSYFSPKDNLPQTGWIMKKYLDKPQLNGNKKMNIIEEDEE